MLARGIPFFSSLLILGVCASVLGCQIPNPGIEPQQATLNFPIAVGLSGNSATGTSDFLLVVNSNYDARFNQGSILSLDLQLIQDRFDSVRDNGRFQPGGLGCTNPASWDDPNVECQIGEAVDFMAPGPANDHRGAEVWIDSFASGITRSPHQTGTTGTPDVFDRFYLPTRGSGPHLTWVDVNPDNGMINCEQGSGLRCSDRRRTTEVENHCTDRDVTFSGDPNALVAMGLETLTGDPANADRDVVLMIQRNGTAALFLDHGTGADRILRRTHILTGLPPDAINAELETSSGLAWMNTSSPVSTRATRLLGRVGVFYDTGNEACSQAFAAPSVFLDGLATGFDTRDVAFGSAGHERFAYVLSRSPEAVITIDQNGTPFVPGNAAIIDVDDVGFGPSRMRRVTIGGQDYLIVTCFDGRALWVLRTEPTEVVSIVPGFDGAYELVIDEARAWAIVADFKTSVIRFVDLAPLAHGHAAVVLGRVGTPRTHVGFP
jgi:hypothetical protein